MWLTALLFGSVVELVTDQLKSQSADALNSEPVSELVLHQGQQVDFRHQFWRIDAASVCQLSRHKDSCLPAAKALFAESCQTLSAKGSDVQQANLRAMYCAAAKEGKGTEATAPATSAQSPATTAASDTSTAIALEDLYRECKRTTVLAWISKDEARAKARDAACHRYDTANKNTIKIK